MTFKAGGKPGTATQPACDTGGQDETLPADTMAVYEEDGVPTRGGCRGGRGPDSVAFPDAPMEEGQL